MRHTVLTVSAIVILCAPVGAAKPAVPLAPSEFLQDLDAHGAFPRAMNNRGDIVGSSATGAFLWTRREGLRFLASGGNAFDINDRREIVGTMSQCGASGCAQVGFLWTERRGFVEIADFAPAAINNRGEIAGTCLSIQHACVWRRGVLRAIAGPNTFASDINDRGDVVGASFNEDGPLDAFMITRRGEGVILGPGVADEINNKRVVSGWLSGIDSSAAVWIDGVLVLSGSEPSTTSGVNSSGWVLINSEGFASVSNPARGRGVSLAPLAPEGSAEAILINDRGEIVGYASDGLNSQLVIWRLHGSR